MRFIYHRALVLAVNMQVFSDVLLSKILANTVCVLWNHVHEWINDNGYSTTVSLVSVRSLARPVNAEQTYKLLSLV